MKHFYYLTLILLSVASLVPACKKTSPSNPCDGLLNEGMPTQVGLIFLDGQTGENILVSKDIDTADISITPAPLDVSGRGVIVKNVGAPMYGALVFTIADTRAGNFNYKIDIANIGTATLSYTNKEEKTDNICKPYYINVTDPVIGEHPFTVSRNGSRLIFKITL